MTKRIAVALLVLSLTLVRPAEASINVTRSDASTAWLSTGASITYPIANCDTVRVQVWSAAGSVATVNIDVQSSATAPWYTVATIANPSASGEYWSIPRAINIRINVAAYTSGTISANLEGYNRNERIY